MFVYFVSENDFAEIIQNVCIMENKLMVLFCVGILLSVVVGGCDSKKGTGGDGVAVFLPLSETVEVVDFNEHIESVEMIPLEATDSSLVAHIRQVLLTPEGQFVVPGRTGILLFGGDGKFLLQVGKQGRGAGEYAGLYNVCLSGDGKSVLVLNNNNDVLEYSLSDGRFVRKVTPALPPEYFYCTGLAPSVDGGFFLFFCNPPEESDPEQPFYCLHQFDSVGASVSRSLAWEDYIVPMEVFTQAYDNSYILRPRSGDNICHRIKNGVVDSMLKIDFGKMNIPYQYMKRGESDIQKYMRSPYFKMPTYIQETEQHVYFSCPGLNAEAHYFVMNKETSKGIHWKQNGEDDASLVLIRASDEDSFYAVFHEYGDMSSVSSFPDPFKKFLIKEKGVKISGEDANPLLVKIKFKV